MNFSGPSPPLNLTKPSKDESFVTIDGENMAQCLQLTSKKKKKSTCNLTPNDLVSNTSHMNESTSNSTDVRMLNCSVYSSKGQDQCLKTEKNVSGSLASSGILLAELQRPECTEPISVNSNTVIKVTTQEEFPKSIDNSRKTIGGLKEEIVCSTVENHGPQQAAACPIVRLSVANNSQDQLTSQSVLQFSQPVGEADLADTAENDAKVPLKGLRSSRRSQTSHKCGLCSKAFKTASSLEKHTLESHETHISIKDIYKFNCDQCLATFQLESQLKQHQLTHVEKEKVHKVKVFQVTNCTTCNETLQTYEQYRVHVKMHSKRYQCHECGMTFVQKSYLTVHSRSHTGEKPFKCNSCSASFKQLSHLTTHKRTHTLEKPFNCSMCPARFSQSSSMKRHIRTHTGDKPYVCQVCSVAFTDKRNLTRHMMSHEGKRPYKCTMCLARFTQKIDLIRHNLSHAGVKPFKCTLCSAAFSRQNNLRWHQRTHDFGATIDHCAVCGVGFSNRRDLKQHLRQHSDSKPITCKVCGIGVSCRFSLIRHMKTHNDFKPHACSMCPAAFLQRATLKRHELRHKGIRGYKCKICSRAFFDGLTLKKHRVTVHGEQRFPKDRDNNLSVGSRAFAKEKEMVSTGSSYSAAVCNLLQPPQMAGSDMQVSSNITIHSNAGLLTGDMTEANVSSIIDEVGGGGEGDDDDEDLSSSFGTSVVEIADSTPLGGTVINGGTDASPTLVLTQPGMPSKTYRLAGDCQNHQNHVLTFLEGSTNQWQTWCFCSPQNLPNNSTTTSNNNIASNALQNGEATNGDTINNNNQSNHYFATTQDQQQNTFNIQQSPNTTSNGLNGIDTNRNLPNLQNTLSSSNYSQQQQYEYPDQFSSQTIDNERAPVYTFTTDNYTEVTPDVQMQGFQSRSAGTNIISGGMPTQQLERMDVKPQVPEFVPQTSSSGGGNVSSAMELLERKPVVNCTDGGDSGSMQYSLTVNNPATGNIQVTCDNFQPEGEVETVTTSQGKKCKVYKCSICFRPFYRRVHMMTHMRRHTKEKPFKCKVCSVSFTHSNTLTAHMRSHTGEKPYKCSKCSASFAQKSNLTAHERIHSGEKPYRCEVCFMGFRQASHLPTHMRTHSNERPYQCSECEKRFTQKSALKRHMKTHSQTKAQTLLCGVCGVQIASEDYAEHMAAHDGEEVRECPVTGCGQLFKQPDAFKRHLNDHSEEQKTGRDDPPEGDGLSEEVGSETSLTGKEDESLPTERLSTKIEVATFTVTKSTDDKPKVQPYRERKTKGVGKRKGKLKSTKKLSAVKKDPPKVKSVADDSSERKSAIPTSSRVSLRIREAAGKKKRRPQDNDFITGDLSDLDEHEYLTDLANSVVDDMKNDMQNGKSKKGRPDASSTESDMGAWCFCEVPHASDQPHTSAQVPNNSVQLSAKPSEQTIVYSTQHPVPGIGVDGRGPYINPQESVPVTLNSDSSSIQLAHDGTAEIFAFIDSKGQFVKASSGQILATKELTAVGELLTMGQTTSSSNSIQVSGQSSDPSNLMTQHHQNISATSCYVSLKDISQSLMTSDGTVIHSEINMDTIPVPGQRRVHGSTQPTQSSIANSSQQIVPLIDSVASTSSNASYDNLATPELEASDGSCPTVSSNNPSVPETRVQILGTVTQDGKMQLFNNDGQMQVIDATTGSSSVQMFDSLSAVQTSHSAVSEMLTHSGLVTCSSTSTISGGYVVSSPGSSHEANQRHIQVLNGSSSIEVLPTSRHSHDASSGGPVTISTVSGSSTATTSSNTGSSVEVLLLNDKSQQHQDGGGQECASSLFLEAAMVMQLQDNVFYNTTDGQMLQISGGSREVSTVNITGSPPPCSGGGIGETVTYTIQGSAEVALQPSTMSSSTTVSGGVTITTPLMQNIIPSAVPLVQASTLQSRATGDMNYACQMCDKYFSHYREFINHVKTKHPSRHMCPVCYKLFESADYLAAHTRDSHQTKSSVISVAAVTGAACPDCGIDLGTKAKLTRHQRDVHNKGGRTVATPRSKKVRCKPGEKDEHAECDDIKSLNVGDDDPEEVAQDSLSDIIDEQLDTNPNKSKSKWWCNYCTETFASQCDMVRHKLQHTGEKPYKCSWCKASFTRKSSLNNHSRIHTGARPYACSTCGESFCYRYQYNRHRSTHDSGTVA